MKSKLVDSRNVATASDYATGRHFAWEVAAHEAEEDFFKKTYKRWTYDFRRTWLARYLAITPVREQYVVKDCSVCQEEISKAILENRRPFECPEDIRKDLNRLTRKIGGVLGHRRLSAMDS